jgi:hypothetical protein
MGVFDGEIYRIRARFDDDPDLGPVTVYTEDPRGYFDGLAKNDLSPTAATVDLLTYVTHATDYSFGDYYDDEEDDE